ncbi:MAG: hypothetical protein KDA57_21650 [Planctomycetales bacterium]|nr:hypothetical protein [Planctomycetales bacterium]
MSESSITRPFIAIDPGGREIEACLSVAAPTEKPGGEWGVFVHIRGLDEKQREIFGVDGWQATQLGMRFLGSRLDYFYDQHWRFRWEAEGDVVPPADLLGAI